MLAKNGTEEKQRQRASWLSCKDEASSDDKKSGR